MVCIVCCISNFYRHISRALLNVVLPVFIKGADSIFVYVYSASILPGMIPWFMILLVIYVLEITSGTIRRASIQNARRFIRELYHYCILIIVLIGMLINKETVVSVDWDCLLVAVSIYYFIRGHHKAERQN